MIDFRKHTTGQSSRRPTEPKDIYDKLDRASDKGPLRPVQTKILEKWWADFSTHKDAVLKLHTGEGKTLLGLLILQSGMNRDLGPGLYLCPNNHLVQQTCQQAYEFGFRYTTFNDELPDSFIDSDAILITSVQKLFNGLTKFKLDTRAVDAGTIVIDDAHAAIPSIKSSFSIEIGSDTPIFNELLNIFEDDLRSQGEGTFADIKSNKFDAFLPVPYWAWHDKHEGVLEILDKHKDRNEIKFAWPLLRDSLRNCLCIISGTQLLISPYSPPIDRFQTFSGARHRLFMSATIYDDSYLLKGLNVSKNAVKKPLYDENASWSGEKMILAPSLIDNQLDDENVLQLLSKPATLRSKSQNLTNARPFGIVALTPSFKAADPWRHHGAQILDKDTIFESIEKLKRGNCDTTFVIANRYDGIDLPDDACRILVLDGKPFSENLLDRYEEAMRGDSDVIQKKLVQTIEQGMGRHIRGEKDYGVVLLLKSDLVKSIRTKRSRIFFSNQTQKQIEIGIKIAEIVNSEKGGELDTISIVTELIDKVVSRGGDWKDFYSEHMSEIESIFVEPGIIEKFDKERQVEAYYVEGDYRHAANKIQEILDNENLSVAEIGWYLQEKARVLYPLSKVESLQQQKAAHRKNRELLMPEEGVEVEKLTPLGEKRVSNIRDWVNSFDSEEDFNLTLQEIRTNLQFGTSADKFERTVETVGAALGFASERPDKKWKKGPDNIWCLRRGKYCIIECKSEVKENRKEISKDEANQMNSAAGWFSTYYPDADVVRILVHPARSTAKGAYFNYPTNVMAKKKLREFRNAIESFLSEFSGKTSSEIDEYFIDSALRRHKLQVDDIESRYSDIAQTG